MTTAKITAWEFTAKVQSWIDVILTQSPRLPFTEARGEGRTSGSLKRRDLTLYDRNQMPVLTGEVKLPFAHDGGSPYNHEVVRDAREKAARAKVRFFFTRPSNETIRR